MEKPHQESYMRDVLSDFSDSTLSDWLSKENLRDKPTRVFEGFEITASIDGNIVPNREVSLVKLRSGVAYPQHVHKNSDAYVVIVSGEAVLLSGTKETPLVSGDKIQIPRGMPHGFKLAEGQVLEFISIQSPPIRDPKSGEEDLHLTDLV